MRRGDRSLAPTGWRKLARPVPCLRSIGPEQDSVRPITAGTGLPAFGFQSYGIPVVEMLLTGIGFQDFQAVLKLDGRLRVGEPDKLGEPLQLAGQEIAY